MLKCLSWIVLGTAVPSIVLPARVLERESHVTGPKRLQEVRHSLIFLFDSPFVRFPSLFFLTCGLLLKSSGILNGSAAEVQTNHPGLHGAVLTSACPCSALPSSLRVSCSSSRQRSHLATVSNSTDCLEIKDLRASVKPLNRTCSKSTTIYCGSHRAEGNSNSKGLILDSDRYSQI